MNQAEAQQDDSLGFLDVLNIGAGHLTFRFERNDAEEVAKAKKVIEDMLRRGYMIFVEADGKQKRVRSFDAAHECYILEEPDDVAKPNEQGESAQPKRKRETQPRAPLRTAKATAIGPTAGG
ncbi:MAG TPA: hypothetical protein VFC78_09075 [Tepidisphaeraceae bacterium]|nr:hypothetical protein [Tepidisphaeraceae bacterium]